MAETLPRPALPRWSAVHRQLLATALLAGSVVFGLMCVPMFLGRVYTTDDLGAFHLPLRDFYARQLAAGEPWDWMPSLFCGFYVSGEGQLGGYHPLHWLLYRTLPLAVAFDLELLVNYPLMAVGTWLFLRRIPLRRDAAAVGALVFTFSSFNLLHFVHPNAIAVMAHLPWLLWAIDFVCRSASLPVRCWASCGVALLVGSQLLLGYPQYVWFSWMTATCWGLLRLRGAEHGPQRVLCLVAAFALGVLIGGAQLLPTFDALSTSSRQQVTDEFRSSGSLHPLNLIQPLVPYLFAGRVPGQNTHELGLYFGCVPLVLCYWMWLERKRWGRTGRVLWPTLVLTTLATLYVLGDYGPVYWLQAWLPVVGNFRFPCRAIVLVELGVAVFTAVAFSRVLTSRTRPSNELWIPAGLSLFFSVYALFVFSDHAATLPLVAAGPVLLVLATWLVRQAASGVRWAPALLIALTAADLAAYGLTYAVWPGTVELQAYIDQQNLPPQTPGTRIAVNTGFEDPLLRFGNRPILAGYSLADGYAGLEPAPPDDISPERRWQLAGILWKRTASGWEPLSNPQARATWAVAAEEPQILTDKSGQITLDLSTSHDNTLVLSESFHRGWQAQLDGGLAPIMRAEGGFLQVAVPAGKHRLELQFAPASLRYGLLLSTCGLGFTLCWAVGGLVLWGQTIRNKRRATASVASAGAAAPNDAAHSQPCVASGNQNS